MSDGGETVSEPEPSSPVQLLLAVQDEDLRIDQLAYRLSHLPPRLALDALATEERQMAAERRRIATERVTLDEQLARLEEEVAECDERTAAIERRLKTADAGSFRDQEAMSVELAAIAARKVRLEEDEFSVLELLEPLEQALQVVEATEEQIDERRGALSAQLVVEEAELAAERAAAVERRTLGAAAVPTELRTEYERIRSRLGGIGVARVLHGTCAGCNLSLSSTELDHIRHGGHEDLFHCEQCGRILAP
jgi:hypothetical protein